MKNQLVFIQDEKTGIIGVVEDEVIEKANFKVRVLAIEDDFEDIYGTVVEVAKNRCFALEKKEFSFGEILFWHSRTIKNRLISCVNGKDRTNFPVCNLSLEELKGNWRFKTDDIFDLQPTEEKQKKLN